MLQVCFNHGVVDPFSRKLVNIRIKEINCGHSCWSLSFLIVKFKPSESKTKHVYISKTLFSSSKYVYTKSNRKKIYKEISTLWSVVLNSLHVQIVSDLNKFCPWTLCGQVIMRKEHSTLHGFINYQTNLSLLSCFCLQGQFHTDPTFKPAWKRCFYW